MKEKTRTRPHFMGLNQRQKSILKNFSDKGVDLDPDDLAWEVEDDPAFACVRAIAWAIFLTSVFFMSWVGVILWWVVWR